MNKIKTFFTNYIMMAFLIISLFSFLFSLSIITNSIFSDFEPFKKHISKVKVLVDEIGDVNSLNEIQKEDFSNKNILDYVLSYEILENSSKIIFTTEEIKKVDNFYYIENTKNIFHTSSFIILKNYKIRKVSEVQNNILILNDGEIVSFEDVLGIVIGHNKND